MSGEDREEGRDIGGDETREQEADASQSEPSEPSEPSEDGPLSDLRRDIERRRGRNSERTDDASGPDSGDRSATESDAERDQESYEGPGEEPRAKGPLSNLREGVERRRRERRESPPEVDEAFEAAASEPVIDGEQVWADLLASNDESSAGLAFGEEVEGEAEDVRIIPDRVCHNCTYFGDPPELHCEHEGTEIRRVVDHDHFEVVECPVVKNRSDLAGQ